MRLVNPASLAPHPPSLRSGTLALRGEGRRPLGFPAHDALASLENSSFKPITSSHERLPSGADKTMKSPICDMLGIEFPLLAFSHCRDVVAAVSRAGGFGVLGATSHTPESIEQELKWIDDHVDGKPYGIDVLIPENISTAGEKDITWKSLEARVTPEHRAFTRNLLKKYGIELTTTNVADNAPQPFDAKCAMEVLDVAFTHPIRQVAAGVDILVAQGTEAGGHCGEVSTMVLVPEVIKAVKAIRDVPVLAAGGIMTGRQMAACMAMGAAGAWTGSVWLATVESETTEIFREKMIAASSRDAIRSKGRTGKPARQLRSVWTDAWDRGADSPGALPMPLQSIISRDAFNSIDRAAAAGNAQARDLVSYFVGQGVGLIDSVKSAGAVVQEFKEDFVEAVEHMNALMEE